MKGLVTILTILIFSNIFFIWKGYNTNVLLKKELAKQDSIFSLLDVCKHTRSQRDTIYTLIKEREVIKIPQVEIKTQGETDNERLKKLNRLINEI